MKKRAFVLALALMAGCCGFLPAADYVPVPRAYAEIQRVDQEDVILADGYASMPAGMPAGRAKLMARRGAIMDAQRVLLDTIKGTAVDAESTMVNFITTSDVLKTKVQGVITGARIIAEDADADGNYHVRMAVPAYGVGSVAEAAINAVVPDNAPPVPVAAPSPEALQKYVPEPQVAGGIAYTGIIIDAKNSALVRTYCPAIFDTNGRAIYGVHNVDKDYAISKGVVEYAEGSEQWNNVGLGNSRAGRNPLTIKIVKLRERCANQCDVVISVEDADKILIENQRSHILDNYAVVFEK